MTTLFGGAVVGANMTEECTSAIVVGGDIDNVDVSGSSPLLHIYPNSPGSNTDVTKIAGISAGETYASVYAAA